MEVEIKSNNGIILKRVFTLEKDGFWVTDGFIINKERNLCAKHPWFGDAWCPAPLYEFKIII